MAVAAQSKPEIEVELPLDGGTVATPEPAEEPDLAAEIAELKTQLAAATAARQEAETRAQSVQAEKSVSDNRAQTELANRFAAQEMAVASRIKGAETGLATSKAEFVRAQSEQRWEDAANLAEAISDYKTELKAANWDKGQVEAHKQQAIAESQRPKPPADPVEAFLAIIPGEPSKRWLRSHPEILKEVANGGAAQRRLFAYANLAEAEGHSPDTDSYFEFIDNQYKPKETPVTVAQPARQPAGRTANAAPSSRSAPSSEGTRTISIKDVVKKLNANDRANAKWMFPGKTEDEAQELYATGLVKQKQTEPGYRPDIKL